MKVLTAFASSLAAVPAAAAATIRDSESVDVLIVTLVVIIVTILPAIVICWQFWNTMKVKVQSGINDDDEAVKMFIDILERAKDTLVIYDDGNKMDQTIYDDPRVTQAMRERLNANSNLVVRCLFNDEADLDLVRTIRAEYPDRFMVWYRCGSRPPGDIHYKIADGGAVIHISAHEYGQPERKFKLLDCTAANRRTKRIALDGHLDRFENDIKEHAVAAT